jgi:hypothetical protein
MRCEFQVQHIAHSRWIKKSIIVGNKFISETVIYRKNFFIVTVFVLPMAAITIKTTSFEIFTSRILLFLL